MSVRIVPESMRPFARWRAFARDMEVMAIRRGFEGMLKEDVALMSTEDVAGILNLGGTFLGMSTLDPTEDAAKIDRVGDIFRKYQMTLLVVMGGHTALKASMRLARKVFQVSCFPARSTMTLRALI